MMKFAADRAAWAAILESLPSTVALTLTYNNTPVGMERIRADLRKFHCHLDRELFGRRFHLHTRTVGWFVVEKLDDNPHVHAGLCLHASGVIVLDKMLEGGLWNRFAGLPADHDCQEYRQGWASYAVKSLQDSSTILMTADFHR